MIVALAIKVLDPKVVIDRYTTLYRVLLHSNCLELFLVINLISGVIQAISVYWNFGLLRNCGICTIE